jgi:hypothetical protein
MWRRPECPRFTLPVAVFLKRLEAPLCDFNFGINPLNQLPAASCQPPVGNFNTTFNCSGIVGATRAHLTEINQAEINQANG